MFDKIIDLTFSFSDKAFASFLLSCMKRSEWGQRQHACIFFSKLFSNDWFPVSHHLNIISRKWLQSSCHCLFVGPVFLRLLTTWVTWCWKGTFRIKDTFWMKLIRLYFVLVRSLVSCGCLMEWRHIKSLIKALDWVVHLWGVEVPWELWFSII